MNAVFLDTVGMLAVWDTGDQWHPAADAAFNEITAARLPVITTTFVLLECANAAARRPFRRIVVAWREVMSANSGLIAPTDEDWSQAWEAYARGEAANASIVDHVSFVVMQRLGITRAFTNDRHFKAAGFETLF